MAIYKVYYGYCLKQEVGGVQIHHELAGCGLKGFEVVGRRITWEGPGMNQSAVPLSGLLHLVWDRLLFLLVTL